ncbi:MAG: DNA-binding protein WhiA [Oscillospiraceae bacterium]
MLTITDRAAIETVFAAFGADLSRTVAHHINLAVLENDCCKASFLRGAFLAGGSVTDPSKNYHLELITAHASVSRETAALLTELGFAARSIDRGANTVLYFKKSEAIEDFLKIGAAPPWTSCPPRWKSHEQLHQPQGQLRHRQRRQGRRRGAEQIDAIRRIERDYGLDVLPELQSAALRIANPGQPCRPRHALVPAGDESCLNYRLKKLMEFHMDD